MNNKITINEPAYTKHPRRLQDVICAILVEVAVKLHGAEWSHKEKSRWWLALVSAAAGFVGALLGAWFK